MKLKELLKKYRRVIILIVAILIIVSIITCVTNMFMNTKVKGELPNSATAFFLENTEGYYSLFNKDGNQLTEYEYINISNFYNGVAKVKDKDSKYGIINEKGNFVVKMGTYSNIYQYGSLFKVEEDSKYSLINKKGKKIIKKKDFDVQTFTGIDSFIVVSYDNAYIVYNYNGKRIYTFKKNDKADTPTANELGKYGSVYYDGLTIIFNTTNGKVISKIKEDTGYCLNSVNEDEGVILLNSCTSWYSEDEKIEYKLIQNNKVKDIKEKCEKLTLNDDILTCTIDDIRYLLNNKLESTKINASDITYQNYQNYAIKKDKDVEIVKNGKVVKTLKDTVLADKGYTKDGIILTYKDDTYTFYDLKGKSLFKKSYKKATSFDKFGLAKVSDDGIKYYFINSKGKKVGPDFTSANINGEYYLYTNDNQYGVLASDGKIIIDSKYTSINIQTINDHDYAVTNNNDEYELIDLATKKTIIKTDANIALYDLYFTVSKDDNIKYYTYKGKEFNK